MNYLETVNRYFASFLKKDIGALSSLLSSDVTLRDWTMLERGRTNVLDATQRIFDSCGSIAIDVKGILTGDRFAVAEIDIFFDDLDALHVVDVYEFDNDGKINFIRAFKG